MPDADAHPSRLSSTAEHVDLHTLRQRQWRVLRSGALTIAVVIVLILIAYANRDEVTIRACGERMKIAAAILQQRAERNLPRTAALPDPLDPNASSQQTEAVTRLREHGYYNVLYANQAIFKPQAGVACCGAPHTRLFGHSGRWVIVYEGSRRTYEVEWMSELEFEQRAADLGLRAARGQ